MACVLTMIYRQNRDVVIKFVDKYSPDLPEGTIEYQILRLLNSPSMRSDPRNATVPVLKFLEFYDWKFVVMPFYDGCDEYVFLTAYECLDFACQVLEVSIEMQPSFKGNYSQVMLRLCLFYTSTGSHIWSAHLSSDITFILTIAMHIS